MRLLLLATLVLGFGVSRSWPGQQSSLPGVQTGQAAGRKNANTTPVRSAKAPAHRKGATSTSSSSSLASGKRDPFKLPTEVPAGRGGVENTLNSAPGGVLPPGARGLLISQLALEGVVREQTANKMIAVVINETKRAYFLTENESVYNGVVSKITPDSIYFKENVLDPNGRVTTREVVKRLGSAPGEGR